MRGAALAALVLAGGLAGAGGLLERRLAALDAEPLAGEGSAPWLVAEVELARALAREGAGGPRLSDKALVALARERIPPEIRDELVAVTELEATVIAALLLPPDRIDRVFEGDRVGPLQPYRAREARAHAHAALDAGLADLVAVSARRGAWVVELADDLGHRALSVADAAAALPTDEPERRDAFVLMIRARAMERGAAVRTLEAAIAAGGPLATVGVLELARLDAAASSPGTAARVGLGAADGALAAWALDGA